MTISNVNSDDLAAGLDTANPVPQGIKTVHTNTYPAISPSRPEVSQAGRTALITGGSAGIGIGIARSYAEASVSRLILTGRRRNALDAAAATLAAEFPKTEFITRVADIASLDDTAALWSGLRADGIAVDVLVLNAGDMNGGHSEPIISYKIETIWSQYETNVRGQLDLVQRFQAQEGSEGKQKYLVYLSSGVIHARPMASVMPGYTLTKQAGQLVIQTLADAADPARLQVVSYHPGSIFSESAKNHGLTEESLPWDNIKLPSDFGVWAASPEAAFLHGRFVWAAWDLGEVRSEEVLKRIKADPDFLTLRLVGM